MSTDTVTGTTVAGRYHITGYQRSGRMGAVYVARRVDDHTLVSIKLLDSSLFTESEAVKRFENECLITSKLTHPCSLTVIDYGRSERGHPFMVTEYVVGELLAEAIDEGPMAPERAAWIAAQIALALDAAHTLGVIHRDLSPRNVLLAEHGSHSDLVKVLEFGLSRMTANDTGNGLTAVGVRIGSPDYMSPEYIEEYALDHRADLYALGVVLFEMLTGELPFIGRPYKVMDLHLTKPMPVPSERIEGVPPWIDELVEALTRKAPTDRIQTAAEVIQRIEAGLGRTIEPVVIEQPAQAPPPEPSPKVPDVDPVLVHFIKECLVNAQQGPGHTLDPRECLVVERVAQPSIASELGIRPGYLLQLPNESFTGTLSPELTTPIVDDRRYVFASPEGSHTLELRTNGIPLGAEYMRTVAHIKSYYDPTGPDPMPLLEVWKQRDWNALERLSWRALSQQRGAAGMLNTGLFAKFLGRGEIRIRNHPALLLHGAARIEKGDKKGMEQIQEFRINHSLNWHQAFNAVAHFYMAMDNARRGSDDDAVQQLLESLAMAPFERAQQALEKMVGQRAVLDPSVGHVFPEYSMDTSDRRTNIKLSQTLAAMDASQVLIICMLGGYRGNKAYDEFMHRYLSYAAWFPDFVADMHVISTLRPRDVDHPEHYKGEDIVLNARIPIHILEDYRAFVQRAVKPPRVPTIYVIGKTGVVVHEGHLTPCGWWEALSENGRVRLETFARNR